MPNSKTSATSKMPSSHPGSRSDALALLSKDHKEVKQLFRAYDKLAKSDAPSDERQNLAEQICDQLSVHAKAEEYVFYPAMREHLAADDLLNEAEVEHATITELVTQIRNLDPDDELFDAKVKVLGEYVEHHVHEEETAIFPKALKARIDLVALGAQLKTCKEELMESSGSEA